MNWRLGVQTAAELSLAVLFAASFTARPGLAQQPGGILRFRLKKPG